MNTGTRPTRILLALWVSLLVVMGVADIASAHEFRPAVLSLQETEPGRFHVQWRPPFDGTRNEILEVSPTFPSTCEVMGPTLDGGLLVCGDDGLSGDLSFAGLDRRPADVVLRVTWSSGSRTTLVFDAERPSAHLSPPVSRSGAGQALADGATYTKLGIEHILGGLDHLLFVIGLIVLVGYERRLLWTITGFTVAHSITLALSVLGWVTLPQAPVEAVIALSILLLAVEIAKDRPSLTRTMPAAVAFAFGLLHGLGFSNALMEIGLPEAQLPISLAGFNIGVELGQLAVVAAAYGITLLVRRADTGTQEKLRLGVAYAIGTAAAFWSISRVAGLLALA